MLKTLLLSLAMSAALLASSMAVYTSGTSPRAVVIGVASADTAR